MIVEGPSPQRPGPILLCAGTDPIAAARLAEVAASLLNRRPAVVLAIREPQPPPGLRSTMDALFDAHEELREPARQLAVQTAQAAADVLDVHGVRVTRQNCPEAQSPWLEILDVAEEVAAAVIVARTSDDPMALPGTLGSQARALAHRAQRPLLLVPTDVGPVGAAAPAIIAYDGSPAASHAVAAGARLLRPRPGVVGSVWQTARHVVGAAMVAVPDEFVRRSAHALDEAARLHATGQACEAAARLTAAGWSCFSAAIETSRNVPAAIVETADERDAAVIVTGTRGRSRIAAAPLGSSAEAILRHANRPVLLVPPVAQ